MKRLLVVLVPAVLVSCAESRNVNAVKTPEVACTICHGDASRAGSAPIQSAPPASTTGGNGGAHLAHLERGVACGACHVVPTAPAHSNGAVEVVFSGVALGTGPTPTFSGGPNGTCSNVYCHGAGLGAGGSAAPPAWSGGALGCDACHGSPPPGHDPASTTCSACHAGTVRTDGTINVAGGLHANGNVEAAAGHAAGWADPAQHGGAAKTGLSACKSCHGANLDGIGGTATSCATCHATAGYASWDSNCTFCHGTKVAAYTAASLTSAAPPRGTQGETATTARAVGAHQRHLAGGTIGPAVACAECHAVPTALSHVDGAASVTFGAGATRGGATPTWNGDATCASTYCHGGTMAGGSNPAPSWTAGGTQTSCGSCHGIPPPPATGHVAATTCDGCHTGYTPTSVNLSVHMNGAVDATGGGHAAGWAAKDQHGYAANRQGLSSCTGCHGTDFAGGSSGVSCNACHSSMGWAAWQTNCTFCHGGRLATYTSANLDSAAPPVGTGGETDPATRAVGAHQKHLTGGSIGPKVACATCHTVPTTLAHVTGTPVVSLTGPAALDGVTASFNATAGTCATYCHGASLAGGTKPAPTWTGGSSQTTCGSCHGIPPPTGHVAATTCNGCHTGYTPTSVNLSVHMNGAVDATGGGGHAAGWVAKDQHGYTVNRDGLAGCKTCHGTNLDGVGGTAQSCTACHSTNGFATWATNCTFCHGSAGGSAPPVDTQGGNSTANVSVGAHAKHLSSTWMATPACTLCHPDRAGSNVITDAAHVDGRTNGADVAFAALAGPSAAYTRTSATAASCNSVYCHSTAARTSPTYKTVAWASASPTAMTCSSCHTMTTSGPSTGKHGKHDGKATCAECHGAGYSTTAVVRATHVNGTKNVNVTFTGWDSTTRNCATANCHGRSKGTW